MPVLVVSLQITHRDGRRSEEGVDSFFSEGIGQFLDSGAKSHSGHGYKDSPLAREQAYPVKRTPPFSKSKDLSVYAESEVLRLARWVAASLRMTATSAIQQPQSMRARRANNLDRGRWPCSLNCYGC